MAGLTGERPGHLPPSSSEKGYCQTEGCGHFYVFNVDHLIASAGPDYLVPEILPGVVCRVCGGDLKFKLAMMPSEA
jgi:hypothetical protein